MQEQSKENGGRTLASSCAAAPCAASTADHETRIDMHTSRTGLQLLTVYDSPIFEGPHNIFAALLVEC